MRLNNSESVTYIRIEQELDDSWGEFIGKSRNLISFWKKSLIFEAVWSVIALLFIRKLSGLSNEIQSSSVVTSILALFLLGIAITSIVILIVGIVKVITTFLCINKALDWSPDIKAKCILTECKAILVGIASSTIVCGLAGCAIAGYLIPLALKFCYYKTCKEIIP